MSEYSRFSSKAKSVLKVVRDVLEGAIASGNRRTVVVRNSRSETLFKLSLTIVVAIALALLFFARAFVLLVVAALGVAYYFGYRAVIIRAEGPS